MKLRTDALDGILQQLSGRRVASRFRVGQFGIEEGGAAEDQADADQKPPADHDPFGVGVPQRRAPVDHADVAQGAGAEHRPRGHDVQVEDARLARHQRHHVDRRRPRIRECAHQRPDDQPLLASPEYRKHQRHVVE